MVDTKHKPGQPTGREARVVRRQHSLALKRRLIEQTLLPGASVARIALDNGANTNLLFKWGGRICATRDRLQHRCCQSS